ncbi:MAG: Asp-tRNA(Asn)/Glu-tRNA(Gln) amidotransferase subunit GatB [Bacilli bacterium]|nr:Asp-tRNA(Asn)/Glu-tRNA(Gln) amidotransferase subunit GatB [Bacilli bacterium]
MYKAVIGLEVHCELNTKTKMFSGSINEYSKDPNTNISEIDLAFPGILPLPNKEAVKKALKLAIALNCETPDKVLFDRKNYYYADLPKGYQITQMTLPFGKKGYLEIDIEGQTRKFGIHQLHLEEDTANMEHLERESLLDYNRAGVPLVEIVTDPCFNTESEVITFLENLRNIIKYCDISEASSEKGQLRVDVNISMMKTTDTVLGTRAEIKGINSFNTVKEIITYEIQRQQEILEKGEKVLQETRRWVDDKKITVSMREKVDAIDYKYYVEPNIPPVAITEEYKKTIKEEIPELPIERERKYIKLGVLPKDAKTLVKTKEVSDYYEEVLELGGEPKETSNWLTTRILGYVNTKNIKFSEIYMTPKMLANMLTMLKNNSISTQQAKEICTICLEEQKTPEEIVKEKGMEQISDHESIKKLVDEVLNENEEQVKQYKNGKTNIIGYLVGQVLKASGGKANPGIVSKILNEEINKR